ncbi:MerR family transcriptional regulator [Priestia flexa]|jgi:chromosome-anchoring protein RacA|uniref:Chromosome-anchoring protein RacA n=1 Tax=Priestia flexa TaxID=86664 RepID=A0A8I1MGE0_9BACI|nr:MerR family transcriptional regulator [Priestia flexa]MBN8252597.1 MerR family transcriptional regulator [Priestia flexa]MBN8434066.1 MerR family transcriptional regulator [Priestia flexa]MCA0966599.1 MerR family transcriptional regulator [Priestia flexa]RIV12003.1 MerR family transcriptional regulator [Priestia flexa]UIR31101.1 MerR family transcriptional regulator [Priestia flexa]
MAIKTLDVAKQLGIHPSTVLKWAKLADIDIQRNDAGHWEFTEENVTKLEEFKNNRNRQAVVKVVEASDDRIEQLQKQMDELYDKWSAHEEVAASVAVDDKDNQKLHDVEAQVSVLQEKLEAYQSAKHKEVEEPNQEMQRQIDQLLMRLIENEKRTEEKAGEVVTFQLLEHRKEIDQLTKKMIKLQAKVEEFETRLKDSQFAAAKKPPKWRTFLTGLFTY